MSNKSNTISFAITVCNEIEEIKELIDFLKTHIRDEDEIVIQYDSQSATKEVIEYVSWGESIQIRLISVGDKELSFLSVDNFSDDGKEEFLKGTSFEAKEGDDDFEDFYNECVGSDNLLSFDYVVNYEG